MQARTHNLFRHIVLAVIVVGAGLVGRLVGEGSSPSSTAEQTVTASDDGATTDSNTTEGAADVEPDARPPEPANPAPLSNVEYTTFDGTTGTIADHRGKPVVVNFWASWCPACIAEMPHFEEVHQEFADRVVFLGFDERDSRADAELLAAETGVTYTLVEDPDGEFFIAYDGIAMPTTAFITASGELSERFSGLLDANALRGRLNDLLGESS
ncbi:MAG: TlpA family protein disulfide reductase [Acidimicrobiales bacterium]|jgi:thiol-disulfide isomerase/thioredoxin